MSVAANRSGTNAVVTITEDCSDILAATGVSNAEKKLQCLRRCYRSLAAAIEAVQNPDAALDQAATDYQAYITAVKAARPTGTL